MSAALTAKFPDNRTTFHSERTVVVNGFPAYVHVMSSILTSTSRPLFGFTLSESIYVVRKEFSVACEAYHYDRQLAEKAYHENISTFQAVLESFVVL